MVELAGSEVAVEVGLVEVPTGGNYSSVLADMSFRRRNYWPAECMNSHRPSRSSTGHQSKSRIQKADLVRRKDYKPPFLKK